MKRSAPNLGPALQWIKVVLWRCFCPGGSIRPWWWTAALTALSLALWATAQLTAGYRIRAAEPIRNHPSVLTSVWSDATAWLSLSEFPLIQCVFATRLREFRNVPLFTTLYFGTVESASSSQIVVKTLIHNFDSEHTWLVSKGKFHFNSTFHPVSLFVRQSSVVWKNSERLQSFQDIVEFWIEMAEHWVTRWCVIRCLTNQITEVMLYSLGKHVALVIALESDFSVDIPTSW